MCARQAVKSCSSLTRRSNEHFRDLDHTFLSTCDSFGGYGHVLDDCEGDLLQAAVLLPLAKVLRFVGPSFATCFVAILSRIGLHGISVETDNCFCVMLVPAGRKWSVALTQIVHLHFLSPTQKECDWVLCRTPARPLSEHGYRHLLCIDNLIVIAVTPLQANSELQRMKAALSACEIPFPDEPESDFIGCEIDGIAGWWRPTRNLLPTLSISCGCTRNPTSFWFLRRRSSSAVHEAPSGCGKRCHDVDLLPETVKLQATLLWRERKNRVCSPRGAMRHYHPQFLHTRHHLGFPPQPVYPVRARVGSARVPVTRNNDRNPT